MAAEPDDDGYPDDDEFDEYNPHPYSGGYDIAATYGAPRPPSSATCYPVSTRAAVTAPTAPQPSSSLPQPPAPAPQPPPSSPPPAPPAEPYYWPEPYNWGDAPHGSHHHPMYASPEVFRGWPYFPFSGGAHCRSACGSDYWRQAMRGLDYLFGHSDGYGERRIGLDCTGVPIYANRKGGAEESLVVEVPPPATQTVEWRYAGEDEPYHHQSNRLSWYDGSGEEETYANASSEPSYASYDRPYYEQQSSYSFQDVSDQPSWFPNQMSCQEGYYKDQDDSQYQDYFSYDAYKVSSQPTVCYNQHFGEQPLHIHVEPPETVSSVRQLEYYENFSTENDFDNLESSRNSYEIQPYLHTPCEQLEPYRPSWSQNLGYYQARTEGVISDYDNHTIGSGESWDMSSLFMSPFYPQETQSYAHSYGDENV